MNNADKMTSEATVPEAVLLPCPFCGGAGAIIGSGPFHARCTSCGISTKAFFDILPRETIAAWNRRAALKSIPAPTEGNEAEGKWKLVPVEPTPAMIAAGARGRQNSARESFVDGWRFALAAAPAHAPGELVERLRADADWLDQHISATYRQIQRDVRDAISALALQEHHGKVKTREWPDILLAEIAVIRDEYLKQQQDALDQMEWHASQGDTEETSEFSAEVDNLDGALMACNRILKLFEKFEHIRNSAPVNQKADE